MKKVFNQFSKIFFMLMLLFLGVGNMYGTEVTILPSDFTPVTNKDYSLTKNYVTVAVTASTVTDEQMRIFKNQTITISSDSLITKIEFICTAKGNAKYGPGCFNEQDGYTFESDGYTGTWIGQSNSITFTSELNQVRATQIVVTIIKNITTTDIEFVYNKPNIHKIIKNGEIQIYKDNKVYNIYGNLIN